MTYFPKFALSAITVLTLVGVSSCGSTKAYAPPPASDAAPVSSPVSSPVTSTAPAPKPADQTQVIAALQALGSATDVGVNLINYTQLVATAKTQVDLYLTQDNKTAFSLQIADLISTHQVALDWWRCDLEQESGSDSKWDTQARCRDAVLPQVAALTPELKEQIDAEVVKKTAELKQRGATLSFRSNALDKDAVLQVIWRNARVELMSAHDLAKLGK